MGSLELFEYGSKKHQAKNQEAKSLSPEKSQALIKFLSPSDQISVFDCEKHSKKIEAIKITNNETDLKEVYSDWSSKRRVIKSKPDFLAKEFMSSKLKFIDSGGMIVWKNAKNSCFQTFK